MAYYNLRVVADDTILSAICPDHEAALAEFGQKLGVPLTLNEGQFVAEYMMGYRQEPLGFIKTDIPVWRSK